MTQSFREIAKNDISLTRLLKIVDNNSIEVDGPINLGDLDSLCDKIRAIDTKNPKSYSRRIAWTLTGRLLLGLILHYKLQTQILFEETIKLNQQLHGKMLIEKRNAVKRRNQVDVEGKRKRRLRAEIDKKVSTLKQSRFWEEAPLELEKNDITPPDLNLVSSEQITFREIEPPSVPDLSYINDMLNSGFGDDLGVTFDSEDENTMESFVRGNYNEESMIVVRRASFDYDENMNDIVLPEVVREDSNSAVLQELDQKPNLDKQQHSENPIHLLAKVSPLEPPIVRALRKGGKRQSSAFKDDETIIPGILIKKRLRNAFFGCNVHKSKPFTENQLVKLKQADILSVPAMNLLSSHINNLFTRMCKIRPNDVDWTTIQEAFDFLNNNSTASVLDQIDILRNESENWRQTRSSSRISTNRSLLPVLTSTPIVNRSTQLSASTFHVSQSQAIVPSKISPIQFNASSNISNQNDLFDPPSGFQDSEIPFPHDFNSQNYSEPRIQSTQTLFSHLNGQNVPVNEERQKKTPSIRIPDLIAVLGEYSLEYATMKKLLKLWQNNNHSIKVNELLKPQCNRVDAAKTFSSLLILKKKNLVQLENSDDGKIVHISKGHDLVLTSEED